MGKKALSPMIKEVLSQIFTKPATDKYPFVKASVAEAFRGKQVFDINLCVGCGLCSRDCPAQAIEMVDVDEKRKPKVYAEIGSKHRVKRHHIKILNVEEVSPEEIENPILMKIVTGE